MICSIGLLFFFSACQNDHVERKEFSVYSEKSRDARSIRIDTLTLKDPSFTERGYFRIHEGSILFFDYSLLTVSQFNTQGEFIERYLGRGGGPGEIESFQYHGFMPDGRSVFLGTSYDLSIYSKDWSRSQGTEYMDWGRTKGRYTKADIDLTGTYSFNFTNGLYDSKHLSVNSKEEFYMSLWISPGVNPSFHGYDGNTNYFKNSRAIGLANAISGEVLKVFGNKPSQYQEYETTPIFDFFNYDLKDDSLFVAFAAADLMQVYTPNQELAYEFGVAGTDMNKDYEGVRDIETSEKIWRKEYSEKGYYYHVYVSDEDLLFRSYTKNDSLGGLQVYKGVTLVGDFTVPKRFSVLGKIDDYYYADGYIDEESDQLGIYRFRLPY